MLVADIPPVPAQETPVAWVQAALRSGEGGARLDGVRNEATCGAMPVGYCALRGLADATAASPADSMTPATLQSEAQGLLDYTQTLIEGEELMFAMDVPSVPAQQTPIVLVQAATLAAGSSNQQPDYILKDCSETENGGDPRSAMRAVDPAYMLKNYIQNRDKHYVELAAIKTTLLEGTTHGKISSVVDNTGRPWYRYDAEPNYVGKDKAVFMAEFEGKRYKIVLDLHVFDMVNENSSTCPPPQLIKVKKPASGSSGLDLTTIPVTFADLANGAIGQRRTNNPPILAPCPIIAAPGTQAVWVKGRAMDFE